MAGSKVKGGGRESWMKGSVCGAEAGGPAGAEGAVGVIRAEARNRLTEGPGGGAGRQAGGPGGGRGVPRGRRGREGSAGANGVWGRGAADRWGRDRPKRKTGGGDPRGSVRGGGLGEGRAGGHREGGDPGGGRRSAAQARPAPRPRVSARPGPHPNFPGGPAAGRRTHRERGGLILPAEGRAAGLLGPSPAAAAALPPGLRDLSGRPGSGSGCGASSGWGGCGCGWVRVRPARRGASVASLPLLSSSLPARSLPPPSLPALREAAAAADSNQCSPRPRRGSGRRKELSELQRRRPKGSRALPSAPPRPAPPPALVGLERRNLVLEVSPCSRTGVRHTAGAQSMLVGRPASGPPPPKPFHRKIRKAGFVAISPVRGNSHTNHAWLHLQPEHPKNTATSPSTQMPLALDGPWVPSREFRLPTFRCNQEATWTSSTLPPPLLGTPEGFTSQSTTRR
ncbi:collagen alpha-1(II) chain-like [Dromiciops gliroides]|uniref:collagen alpha-1(II) chain-like n=1 Tax=Dromiciops gliroides TaxID=33562 RepID=UPI001CC7CA98|nr:collagen alpha-1(II) chain-like [Dromiciops gliroides]